MFLQERGIDALSLPPPPLPDHQHREPENDRGDKPSDIPASIGTG
jgi:hypothetical protein